MLKIINLEDGRPTIPQALARLASGLNSARQSQAELVKIIHGYGSSGVGGDLRIAIQAALQQMAQRGEIQACTYGEEWRKSDARTWERLKRFPELKHDRDLGGRNKGITIVVL
jgi:hypothetical protein